MRLAKGTHIAYGGDVSTENQIFLGTIVDLEKQEDGPTWFSVQNAINFTTGNLDNSLLRKSATYFSEVSTLDEITQSRFDSYIEEVSTRMERMAGRGREAAMVCEPVEDHVTESSIFSRAPTGSIPSPETAPPTTAVQPERIFNYTQYPTSATEYIEMKNHTVGVSSPEFKNLCLAYDKVKEVHSVFDGIVEETGQLMLQNITPDLQKKIIDNKIKHLLDFEEVKLVPGESYILKKEEPFQVMYVGNNKWFDPTKGFDGILDYLYITDLSIFKNFEIKKPSTRQQTIFEDNYATEYKLLDLTESMVIAKNTSGIQTIEPSSLSANWTKAITWFCFMNQGQIEINNFEATKLDDWSAIQQLVEARNAECSTSQDI